MVYKVTVIGKIHRKQKSSGINWAGAAVVQLLLPGIFPLLGTVSNTLLLLQGQPRRCRMCSPAAGCWEGFPPQGPAQSLPCVCLQVWHSGGDESRNGEAMAVLGSPGMGWGHSAFPVQPHLQHPWNAQGSWSSSGEEQLSLSGLHSDFAAFLPFPLAPPGHPLGWVVPSWVLGAPKLLYLCPLQLERGEKIKGEANTGRDPSLATITGTTA